MEGAWHDSAYGFYWTEGNRGVGWACDAVPTLKGSTTVSIPSPPAIWVLDDEPGRQIVRPSIEAAERAHGDEWREGVKKRTGGYPTIRYFDLFLLIDNENGKVTEFPEAAETRTAA